jgi:hypothetical protein
MESYVAALFGNQVLTPQMKGLISRETQSRVKALGIYQIIGGAIGILLICLGINRNTALTGIAILIYSIIFLFFAFSVLCGVLCLAVNKSCLRFSLINQILQVVGFAMMGIIFHYVAGFYVTVGVNLTNSIEFRFGAGISTFQLYINTSNNILELHFNLIAIGLVYWISKLLKTIKKEILINKSFQFEEK